MFNDMIEVIEIFFLVNSDKILLSELFLVTVGKYSASRILLDTSYYRGEKILLLSLEIVFFVLLLIFNVLAVLTAVLFVLLSLNVEW